MITISIPYGHGQIEASIQEERLAGILTSRAHHYQAAAGEEELVKAAIDNPIGSPRLRDLAKGRQKIVIITSDHTRPVPTQVIAPLLLAEIRSGNPDADITFLVATGSHRASTKDELLAKFGPQLFEKERIVVHDCRDQGSMLDVGRLPSGGKLIINRLAMEADLLIAEGFIEPHLLAGFSGGRKSVLPGIVSLETVLANHCARFVAHEKTRVGVLDGPIHTDMLYAARQAKVAFILNVVIDANKKIVKAFAGDLKEAHLAGCKFVGDLAAVQAKPADIVITSNGGYPLDQNIYQLVKGLASAVATCKPGGVIIMCAACNDGHGGESFFRWFKEAVNGAEEVLAKIMKIGMESTVPEQWGAQLVASMQLKHPIIIVTDQCDHQIARDMGFKAAATLTDAMAAAEKIVGCQAQITVIPDGVAVIVSG